MNLINLPDSDEDVLRDTEEMNEIKCEDDTSQDFRKIFKYSLMKEKLRSFINNVTVEPIVFFFLIGYAIQAVVTQALIFDQTCLISMGHDEQYCRNVTNRTVLESIEGTVSDYNVYVDVITELPFVFMAVFLGPFCDTHGPKLLLVVAIVSHVISEIVFIAISVIRYISPEYNLLGHAVKGIVGSFRTFYLGIDTYIAVSSSVRTRTTRMSLLGISYLLGLPIGSTLGGLIYGHHNYVLVFACSCVITSMALLWALVFFRNEQMITGERKLALREVVTWRSVKTNFKIFTMRRPERKHLYVVVALVCGKLLQIPLVGDRTMLFPFTKLKFNFEVKDYSFYDAYVTGLNCFSVTVIIPILSYYMKIDDVILGIAAFLFSTIGEISIAFSKSKEWFYIGSTLLMFSSPSHIVTRSLMTKCVEKDEQGKLISTYALLSAGFPILMEFVYNRLFHSTIGTFPGAAFLISAAIYLIAAVGFLWIYIDIKRHQLKSKYHTFKDDVELEDGSQVHSVMNSGN